MLAVDAGIFLSFLFAYVHVSMRLDVCPPPGARLPAPWLPALSVLLTAGGAALVALALRVPLAGGQRRVRWLVGIACALLLGGYGLELGGQVASGLNPVRHAWGAAVATLVAYQGLHVLLCVCLGAYVVARSLCRHLTPASRGSLDNAALIWYYTAVQAGATGAAVHVWPLLME
jgi:cytochrome c oxidase subunit I+III